MLKQIDQRQANEVLASLLHANIHAEKKEDGKSGYSVLVGKNDFAAAVDILKIYDLPSKSRVEISNLFPDDALVTSPRAEKARLFSAVEQRLEQSLLTFPSVATARLHISYEVEDIGSRSQAEEPVHLAAVLTYENNMDEAMLINEIKHFLKNSVRNASYDNISVVVSKMPELRYFTPQTTRQDQMIPIWVWGLLGVIILTMLAIARALWLRRRQRVVHSGVM